MKIYSMTATFGKLDNQTLTLQPGLNVIEAPNEWGKSTWCGFLVAMLYGIETSQRTSSKGLADKERYAPWSGKAMSGRMDLCWNGRDITIERSTKGRSVFGVFRAYETATGVPVEELTAQNCGLMLLGVEKSVFTKTGFLKLSDMPVTDDLALRRRLNALVTTGDESGESDRLAQKLKDLKNRCRHNKTGLLPEAEAQQKALTDKLQKFTELQDRTARLHRRQQELSAQIAALENHKAALAYTASQEDLLRVQAAQDAADTAADRLEQHRARCHFLPDRETAENTIVQLEQLQMQWTDLSAEALPPVPQLPETPAVFLGMTPEQAVQWTKSDRDAYTMLCRPLSPVFLILAAVMLLAAIGCAFINYLVAIPLVLFSGFFIWTYLRNKAAQTKDREAIVSKYPDLDPDAWLPTALAFQAAAEDYARQAEDYRAKSAQLTDRRDALQAQIDYAAGGDSLAECLAGWKQTLEEHDRLGKLEEALAQANTHAAAMAAMAKTTAAPEWPDDLTLTVQQTQQSLTDAAAEQQLLHVQLGQLQGQMEALGSKTLIQQQLTAVNSRIAQLEDTYTALALALENLQETARQLQRRFAPQIAQKAQELFGKLTGGRYDRVILDNDLSVSVAAQGETTLQALPWRSDGTVDQLYLSLRLAVANALTPEAPLVLDDALVRFDGTRLAQALELLKQQSESRQVILFTCQSRENEYLGA